MIRWIPFVLLCFGCASVNRGRLDPTPPTPNPGSPTLTSFISRAQPTLIVTKPPSVSIVDWELLEWDYTDPAESFNLYYSFATPTGYDHVITDITNLSCAVSNLVPGITYYLAVTAVATNGEESDFSPQLVFTMPTTLEMNLSLDSSVTNVSVQMSTNMLAWQPANARPRTNGLWRVDVDPNIPIEFFRGVGQL